MKQRIIRKRNGSTMKKCEMKQRNIKKKQTHGTEKNVKRNEILEGETDPQKNNNSEMKRRNIW